MNWDTISKTGLIGAAVFIVAQLTGVADAAKAWVELTRGDKAEFSAAADQERAFYFSMLDRHAGAGAGPDTESVRQMVLQAVKQHQQPGDVLAPFTYGRLRTGTSMCTQQCRPHWGCVDGRFLGLVKSDSCLVSQCKREQACSERAARVNELNVYRAKLVGAPPPTRQQLVAEAYQTSALEVRPRTSKGEIIGGPDPSAATKAPAAEPAGMPINPVTLADNNPKGWDIDVFWCGASPGESKDELSRYTQAKAAAERLAEIALAGESVAGQQLGRIRLRPLPEALARRRSDNRRVSGNYIVADDQERQLAEALRQQVNARVTTPYSVPSTRSQTKWYLSLYTCDGVNP